MAMWPIDTECSNKFRTRVSMYPRCDQPLLNFQVIVNTFELRTTIVDLMEFKFRASSKIFVYCPFYDDAIDWKCRHDGVRKVIFKPKAELNGTRNITENAGSTCNHVIHTCNTYSVMRWYYRQSNYINLMRNSQILLTVSHTKTARDIFGIQFSRDTCTVTHQSLTDKKRKLEYGQTTHRTAKNNTRVK